MDNILTVPAFVILLGTLVFFHELGHFTVAKLLKIRVEEFAFGFGPKWIRLFKRGDTEYTIHPIPLGGFVKLAGAEPGEAEMPDGFINKPWWKRFLVYGAGPFMSFALAYVIFIVMGLTFGISTAVNRVEAVQPDSPAQYAGLKPGDEIVRIDNKVITTGEEMVLAVHNSPDKELTIVVVRNGEEITLHATPRLGDLGGRQVGLLGFTPAVENEKLGLIASVKLGTSETTNFIQLIVRSLFSRDVTRNVGGPISIVAATQASVKGGISHFIFLMGILSLSLGIINLLPIPVVDGGQMVLLVAEGVKGRRLSPRTLEMAQRVGLLVIAAIFMMVIYLDLSKLATGKLLQ